MTDHIDNLVATIRELENGCYQFEQAMRSIPRAKDDFGRKMSLDEESNLYVAITGNTWSNYLKAGGDRSMINHQVEPQLDFNGMKTL